MNGRYWLDLFTLDTWDEFRRQGASVSGFRESRWKTVQKIASGDYFLCYLTQSISRWVGILEVTGAPYFAREPRIWEIDDFPARLPVRPVVAVAPEQGVPIQSMKDELSIFKDLKNPNAWTGALRGSPTKWSRADGDAVLARLQDAQRNPTERPLGKIVVNRRYTKRDRAQAPTPMQESDGPPNGSATSPAAEGQEHPAVDERVHTEMQHLLVRLGRELGFPVYVARNDKSARWRGQALGEMSGIVAPLPEHIGLDPKTSKETVRYIDVLWLEKNRKSVRAAFEVEASTSIYSGLLRMSDLLASYPNLSIPLFVVAPEDRRDQVVAEVNRPTFERLDPPLSEIVRFISFEVLRSEMAAKADVLPFLNADWLQSISDSCEGEDQP